MARYIGPVCRLCRREGVKLELKGLRCETPKCPMERKERSLPPGIQSWRRGRGSAYSVRLREKQKVKRYYGIFEKQFINYFHRAERLKGNTGTILLTLLERRLDNVAYKLGFAASRKQARCLIGQGHIRINGHKVDRPSFLVSQGDRISIRDSDHSKKLIRTNLDVYGGRLQSWLSLEAEKPEGVILALPTRDDVIIPVEENLIVEFCSK